MVLNFKRLSQLIKIELNQNFKWSILIIGLIYFVLAFLNIIEYFFEGGRADVDIHSLFISVTIIGGIIIGSSSFGEISKRHSRINYLNLPASPTEKVLSKALVNLILFPLVMFGLFLVQKLIFGGLSNITNGAIYHSQRFDIEFSILVATILFIISIFFYGSMRFNSYAFPLTVVWVVLFCLAVAAFAFLMALIIYPELRQAIAGNPPSVEFYGPNMEDHWLINMFQFLFHIAPLVFVGLSIVCLTEKEG